MEEQTVTQPAPPQQPIQPPIPPVASPQPPMQPPTPSAKPPREKWPFILAGIMGLLLLFGGGFFVLSKKSAKPSPAPTPIVQKVTPTPDPTADWKTYSSHGISFKFPSNWINDAPGMCVDENCVEIRVYDPNSMKPFTENGGGITQVPTVYFMIESVYDSTQTAKDYVDNVVTHGVYSTIPNLVRQNGTVNSLPVELYANEGEAATGNNIVTSNGNKLATLNSSLANLSGNSVENQILSTFKFTNTPDQSVSTQITDKDNLKTVSLKNDSTFSVILSYPPDGYQFKDPVFNNGVIILSSPGQVTPGKAEWVFKAVNTGTTNLVFSVYDSKNNLGEKQQDSFIINVQ